jgi:hypothetical protein
MSANRERAGELYESTLRPRIEALEGLRRSLKGYLVKVLVLIAGPVILFASSDLFLESASDATTVVVNAVLFIAIVAGVLIAGARYLVPGFTTYVNYRARFKREVVADIFKVVSPESSYSAHEGIPADIFDAAGIFSTRGGTVSDDRVRGTIGRTPFEAAEIKRSYSTGGKNSTHHVVFHGLFFHLDFNKALKGLTIVQPERRWQCEMAPRDNVKKVVLENPEFEKEFVVYGTDEVEARYILTPSMMERILALQARAGKPIFLSFNRNRAYLAIHFGRSLFEPSVAATTSREAIEEMADHFGMAEFVVQELDLNTRIWTKDIDDSLLTRPDEGARNLVDEAIVTGGTLTPADLWKKAVREGGGDTTHEPTPRPADTNIDIATTTDGVTVSYGLRLSFWVSLTLSVIGLVVFVSALRGVAEEFGLGAVKPMLEALPVIPFFDSFVPQGGIAGVVGGAFVGGVTSLGWVFFVRRVVISRDAIRVYRGLRPFARKYSRDTYNTILRASSCVFIGKPDGVSLVNPTVSPNLSEEESKWVAWEMEQALKRAS